MIADNRLTENSTWDDRLLAEQLKELSELELDFSLEATGFEMGEIDLRIEGLTADPEDADPADVLPEQRSGSPVTRPGDLWLLDRHRVYCASALEESSYAALMQTEQAAMVFTDPPYNVAIEGNVSWSRRLFSTATSRWLAAKWTTRSSRPSSRRLARCLPATASMVHSSLSSWIGATSVNCWPRVEASIPNLRTSASGSRITPAWGPLS